MRYFFFLLLFPLIVKAQSTLTDTIYFDKDFIRIASKNTAHFFRPPIKKLDETHYLIEDRYMSTAGLQMSAVFLDTSGDIQDGICISYYENGKIELEGYGMNGEPNGHMINYYEDGGKRFVADFNMGSYDGDLIWYHQNGNMRRHEKYKNGNMISGVCFTRLGYDTTYFPDNSLPRFPDGDEYYEPYVLKRLKYPQSCWKKGIEGRVYIEAYFDEKGKIYNAKVYRGVDSLLDAEALRIIKGMPAWEPAIDDNGNPKKDMRILDILFKRHTISYLESRRDYLRTQRIRQNAQRRI